MPPEGILRIRAKDGTFHEIELTAEQAMDVLQGRAVAFTSPEVPDIGVDEDGTLTEREDARPKTT
jgi:hypothetical protein